MGPLPVVPEQQGLCLSHDSVRFPSRDGAGRIGLQCVTAANRAFNKRARDHRNVFGRCGAGDLHRRRADLCLRSDGAIIGQGHGFADGVHANGADGSGLPVTAQLVWAPRGKPWAAHWSALCAQYDWRGHGIAFADFRAGAGNRNPTEPATGFVVVRQHGVGAFDLRKAEDQPIDRNCGCGVGRSVGDFPCRCSLELMSTRISGQGLRTRQEH